MSAPVALTLCPSGSGWAVCLTNGQELVRYRGPFARQLATRYLRRYAARLRHG
jgi:hypothetical protein